ncbi:MAG TPA: transporter [Sphingomicrobium sp.]|nr:transporter [Sphingomicrobium sp.]
MRIAMTFGALAAFGLTSPTLAADNADAPICTDRPTKANAVCTVPAGRWQLESSAVSWARTESGDVESKVLTLGSTVVKLGLGEQSDLQVAFTPYVRVESSSGSLNSTESGAGDVTLRYKHRLTAPDARVQLALIPFVKLPTADGDIGNGKVEGGMATSISTALVAATLTFGPELDLLADSDGEGSHVQLVNLVNIAGPVAPGLTLAGELWTATNFDPHGTVTQASADAALAYLVDDELQIDAGANVGLTKHTPDMEFYLGISWRF